MAVEITRTDMSASELRAQAARTKDAKAARRMLAIALVLDGTDRKTAAEACGMDPLAFRLKNYAETEPLSGKPFSSKALRECYAQGAERFGWSRRPLQPRQMRDANGLLVAPRERPIV